jgi:hypothetical protein
MRTTEGLRETIERAKATDTDGWMVIRMRNGQTTLAGGGTVKCCSDAVEFLDDDEERVVLPYDQIAAVKVGKD